MVTSTVGGFGRTVIVRMNHAQASGAGRQRQTQGDLGTQSHGTRSAESAGLPKPRRFAVRPTGIAAQFPVMVHAVIRLGLVTFIAFAGVASFHH
jgi:hypothetical protein